MRTLDFIEQETLRRDLPPFKVGDTVAVHVRVREGDKERIQVFQGLVIRRKGGSVSETFTVRKISSGVGVERIFPVQSPLVTKIEIKARGFVRRSKLYYLRDLSGKKARLTTKVRDLSDVMSPEEAEAALKKLNEVPEVSESKVDKKKAKAEAAKGDKKLKGKARKKALAEEKTKRMAELKKEDEARAAKKAKEEAEQAAAEAAEAKAAAEAAEASETSEAAEAPETAEGETES